MARVDCSQYLDDKLYNDAFSGVDHSGILLHSATLLGQGLAAQTKCAPPSHSVLAESSGKVQCQGDDNCGFYSVLNGLRSHANEDTRFFHPLSDVRRLKERIVDAIVRHVTVGLVHTVAQLTTQGIRSDCRLLHLLEGARARAMGFDVLDSFNNGKPLSVFE